MIASATRGADRIDAPPLEPSFETASIVATAVRSIVELAIHGKSLTFVNMTGALGEHAPRAITTAPTEATPIAPATGRISTRSKGIADSEIASTETVGL